MKHTLTITLLSIFTLFICNSCKKTIQAVENPATNDNTKIVSAWALTNISGQIDSTAVLNGVTSQSVLKTNYDSTKLQIIQSINSTLFIFPYKLSIKFNGDGSAVISEAITQPNSANISTNYSFLQHTYWNLTSGLQSYNGLNILGFEKTHIFGSKAGLSTSSNQQGSIQYLLANPLFGAYDLTSSKLTLYLHLEYSGNPDVVNKNGSITNPAVNIVVDYVLTFKKGTV
jgi:hypothetical protein